MTSEEFFGPSDAEREIERINRIAKRIFWKTPQEREIVLIVPPTVYPPKEDTDLMARTLHTLPNPQNKRMLEVGCGSGALSIFAAHLGYHITACDINPFAVAATRHAAQSNGIKAEIREGGPGPRSDGTIEQWSGGIAHDLIVWNLPYMDTTDVSEMLGPFEDAALIDTDETGLVHRLLTAVEHGRLLNTGGVILLLVSNKYHGKKARYQALKKGFAVRSISKHCFEDGECLEVLGLWKPYESSERIFETQVGSTNSDLLASNKPEGTFLHAEIQTDGHGRRGRTWSHESRAFAGSWVIHEHNEQPKPGQMQFKSGIALHEAICALTDHETKVILKWPNDLLLNTETGLRKAGGTLIESRSQSRNTRAVLGIGCNLTSDSHQKGEFEIATLDEIGIAISNKQFARVLHASVASMFEQKQGIPALSNNEIISLYTECFSKGFEALGAPFYRNEAMVFESLQNTGELLLKDMQNKTHVVDEGEHVKWSNYR